MQFDSPSRSSLAVVACHGLSADLATRVATVVVNAEDVETVRMQCRTDRTAGLLAGAVRAGEIGVPTEQVELILDDCHQGLRACVVVEALLVRLAMRLDAGGVRWAVTKGSAIAHLDFPDPALRLFADVDVVIHPDDWAIALESLDGGQVRRPRTRSFIRQFGKGETLLIDDTEADLHLRFAVGRFGTLSTMEDCFRELDSFELAGRAIPALSAEYRLLHACFHATLGGNPGMRAYRDVAQLVSAQPHCVDEMWRVAERWRATAVVATALLSTWDVLQLRPDHPAFCRAREVRIGRTDRDALAVFASNSSFRGQARTTLSTLPWHQRPRFLWSAWQMSREAHS